jgi:hypothetical protein
MNEELRTKNEELKTTNNAEQGTERRVDGSLTVARSPLSFFVLRS